MITKQNEGMQKRIYNLQQNETDLREQKKKHYDTVLKNEKYSKQIEELQGKLKASKVLQE